MTDRDELFGAWTLRGEAEGEGEAGMLAVAWVIRNRAARKGWPGTITGVVLQPMQFSFWNGDSTRRAAVCEATDLAHQTALLMLLEAYGMDDDEDPTKGADHYYAEYIGEPSWASSMTQTVKIGRHLFFDSGRGAA